MHYGFTYFLLEESSIQSISIGIVQVSNLKAIVILTPLILSCLHLIVVLLEDRLDSLTYQAKEFFNLTNKFDKSEDDKLRVHLNRFNISYIPYNFTHELRNIIETNNCFQIFTTILIMILMILLNGLIFVFEYHAITKLYDYWNDSFMIKFICLTSTITVITTFSLSFYSAIRSNKTNNYKA